MSVQERKKQLRREMESKRSAIPLETRLLHSSAICRVALTAVIQPAFSPNLLPHPQPSPAGPVLFTFIPVRAEVDLSPILSWCWEFGVAVIAPRVVLGERRMTLHVVTGMDDLEQGAYGIREPKPELEEWTDLSRIKIMLVPGLAFDASMGRLGYGGGYYDRFMRRCMEQSGQVPFKLALAYDVQVIAHVPMDSHDFRVDAIVTENQVIHKIDAHP